MSHPIGIENKKAGVTWPYLRAPEPAPVVKTPAVGSSGATYSRDDFGVLEVQRRRAKFVASFPHLADRILGRRPAIVAGKTHAITVNLRTGERTVSTASAANPFVAPKPSPVPRLRVLPFRQSNVTRIIAIVARVFEVEIGDMLSHSRRRVLAFPRFAAYRLMAETLGWSTTTIGQHFSKRDHTTVMHGLQRAEWLLERDADWSRRYALAAKELKGEPT